MYSVSFYIYPWWYIGIAGGKLQHTKYKSVWVQRLDCASGLYFAPGLLLLHNLIALSPQPLPPSHSLFLCIKISMCHNALHSGGISYALRRSRVQVNDSMQQTASPSSLSELQAYLAYRLHSFSEAEMSTKFLIRDHKRAYLEVSTSMQRSLEQNILFSFNPSTLPTHAHTHTTHTHTFTSHFITQPISMASSKICDLTVFQANICSWSEEDFSKKSGCYNWEKLLLTLIVSAENGWIV